eukprot:CAMPEP_0113670974 /NCGR_PEP_ID=MMETSP0038_2-20120614/5444_1 /TAXON_ID=2898 /ORGANISM="Cryptomonas paramecium" /LENGTH=82 /DNA_ID=CAMNT_0000587069 /DNA_START=18 /DNA_END=266 /DNA_ORIENTATION=- /assembly_acc=CAM_ASM_000170
MLNSLTAYGRYNTNPSISSMFEGDEPESMAKEFGKIQSSLAWMPHGDFSSFSGGSGTHYSYHGEDPAHSLIVNEMSVYGGRM